MKYTTLIILSLAFLSNCNSTSKIDSKKKETSNQSELEGKYLVTSLYTEDVTDHKITMAFNKENNTISGYSGCNTYSCTYTLEKKSITLGIPSASKRMCINDAAGIEKKFFKTLSESRGKNTKEAQLILINENGEEILIAKKE